MKNTGTIQLETDRLILRKLKEDDYKEIYETWTSDIDVAKYVEWNVHKDENETKQLVDMWMKEYENDYTYRWIVEEKSTNKIMGMIDVVKKAVPYKFCEIGYCYGKISWGKGYGTEALTKVIDYLHNEGFVVLEARHMKDNIGSGRVMEKSGMKYDATLPQRAIDKTGKWQDVLYYSSIKE